VFAALPMSDNSARPRFVGTGVEPEAVQRIVHVAPVGERVDDGGREAERVRDAAFYPRIVLSSRALAHI